MRVGNWRQGDTEIEFCFAFVFTGSSQRFYNMNSIAYVGTKAMNMAV